MSYSIAGVAAEMRAIGAVECSRDAAGNVLFLKLGPAPIAEALDDDDDTQSSRKKLTAEARALADRAEHRRIALAASGRPVRRVSED